MINIFEKILFSIISHILISNLKKIIIIFYLVKVILHLIFLPENPQHYLISKFWQNAMWPLVKNVEFKKYI